jgi:PAS domain S-box-containing protein
MQVPWSEPYTSCGTSPDASEPQKLCASRALSDMLGYRQEELLTGPFIRFIAPESRELVAQRVAARLCGENPPSVYEAKVLRRDGQIIDVELAATVIQYRGKLADVGMVRDITERKQAEESLRVHERQLRVLASELSLTEERERKRIAGELHDHACQSLVLARMRLDELLATMTDARAEAFRGISSTLNETIESVRELTFDLSSPTLYKFGLEAALEELLDDKFHGQRDVEYAFSDDHQPKPLTDDVRILLFQCVREVLINIVKHARAHRMDLDIRRSEDSIRITVTDDGVGFDVEGAFSLPARHRGFGLFNIKERLDYVGGTLEIDSRPGEGSRFALVAPLNMEDPNSGRDYDVGQNSARG